jgi:hypothetical protein
MCDQVINCDRKECAFISDDKEYCYAECLTIENGVCATFQKARVIKLTVNLHQNQEEPPSPRLQSLNDKSTKLTEQIKKMEEKLQTLSEKESK